LRYITLSTAIRATVYPDSTGIIPTMMMTLLIGGIAAVGAIKKLTMAKLSMSIREGRVKSFFLRIIMITMAFNERPITNSGAANV